MSQRLHLDTLRRAADEHELEDRLSTPSEALVRDMRELSGDIVILGAGGKMGPTLAMLARRALDEAGKDTTRVIAVSRWSDTAVAQRLRDAGVVVERAAITVDGDLAALPEAENVLYLVGAKFGVTASPHTAWITNTVLPALVARRYRDSRISALSTGNIYPLTFVANGGSIESDAPAPVGEYAMSCLGRERAIESASAEYGTKASLIRLNYAVEPRYGVIADIAGKVDNGTPIELSTGHVNVVWQRYANEVVLRSLPHASDPPFVLNLTGPETIAVQQIADQIGELLGKQPQYTGTPSATALLSNAGRAHALFGYPDVSVGTLVRWQAEWLRTGGTIWNKATKFERRDGQF